MLAADGTITVEPGTDVRIAALLRRTSVRELAAIAASAAGVEGARLVGDTMAHVLPTANNDRRTLGIVHISGIVEGRGNAPWSAVAKVIDLGVPPASTNTWVRPANEVAVYRDGCFAGIDLGFRPARCHGITSPEPAVTILWLEDLTGAGQAPFDLGQLARMARDLGTWNGANALAPPSLPFTPPSDSIISRWDEWDYDGELGLMRQSQHERPTVDMYRGRPVEPAFALRNALLRLNPRAAREPHVLCFGDCNIGNLLLTPAHTVAVDWAGLTNDPLGVDAGSLIGSAITSGRHFVEVLRHERELFDCYFDGLMASGWRGDRQSVLRGYLLHFGLYLLATAIGPITLRRFDRTRVERRMQAGWDELGALSAGVVDLIPRYVEELPALT